MTHLSGGQRRQHGRTSTAKIIGCQVLEFKVQFLCVEGIQWEDERQHVRSDVKPKMTKPPRLSVFLQYQNLPITDIVIFNQITQD